MSFTFCIYTYCTLLLTLTDMQYRSISMVVGEKIEESRSLRIDTPPPRPLCLNNHVIDTILIYQHHDLCFNVDDNDDGIIIFV